MKYNIPEKYVHIEYTKHSLDDSLVIAKISTPLMPGNSATLTFPESHRKEFVEKLPQQVLHLTHGYSEEELRERFLSKSVATSEVSSTPKKPSKGRSTWTQTATVLSLGDNPFREGSDAHSIFKQIEVNKTIKQNIEAGIQFRVLRASWEKGQLKLSTDI